MNRDIGGVVNGDNGGIVQRYRLAGVCSFDHSYCRG